MLLFSNLRISSNIVISPASQIKLWLTADEDRGKEREFNNQSIQSILWKTPQTLWNSAIKLYSSSDILIDSISANKRQLQLGRDSESINMLFDICQKGASSFHSPRIINSIGIFMLQHVYFLLLGIDWLPNSGNQWLDDYLLGWWRTEGLHITHKHHHRPIYPSIIKPPTPPRCV